jgi:uncharacterized protein YkwD
MHALVARIRQLQERWGGLSPTPPARGSRRARSRHDPAGPRVGAPVPRRLPAALIGVALGACVTAGVLTAPTWQAVLRIGPPRSTAGGRPTGNASPCLGGSTCPTPYHLPLEQQRLIALVTGERARAGCPSVELDSRLQQAAQDHAEAIVANDRPSHIDTGQRTPQDRAEAAGYHGRVQENLAVGVSTADEVIDLWLDGKIDPSLRTRLDNCAATALGLGYSAKKPSEAYGPGVWVLVFGQPESS